MGSLIRAVWLLPLALLPSTARAQGTPPAAAFPVPPSPAPSAPVGSAPGPVSPGSAPSAAAASSAPGPASPAPVAPVAPVAAPAAATGSASAAAGSVPPAPTSAPPVYPAAPYPYPYPPPPPGYVYGYYYPPPPPLPPPLRFPDDAAVSSTPFFDAILVATDWEHRISESVSLGAQAGMYVAGWLRLTAKIAFPTEGIGDQDADFGSGTKAPSLFYAFSVGFAAVRTPTFVLSPGLLFARTDVGDYGSMLGVSLPFDWVLKSGVRLGLEGALGSAFGGRSASCSTATGADCSQRPSYEDRDPGLALWLQFQVGFGFNHPGPLAPTAGPPS